MNDNDNEGRDYGGEPQTVINNILFERRDVVAAGIASGIAEHEEEMDKVGWDVEPNIWSMYGSLPPTDIADSMQRAGFQMMAMMFKPINFQLPEWDGPIMAQVLHFLADNIRESTEAREALRNDFCVHGMDMLGWMLTNEAWMITGDDTEVGVDRDGNQNEHYVRPSQHPKRIEIRVVTAVDTAGFHYQVMRERVSNRVRMIVDFREDEATKLQGRLFEALADAASAIPLLGR
jgi:hypothetical protein